MQDLLTPLTKIELGEDTTRIIASGKFNQKDALDFHPTRESSFLLIDTPNYDGPLDLLLHLIKKHSIDIFDIPIVFITKKYLQALDELKELNLDVAGDFLLMAATLTQIKSKMLLPKEEQPITDDDEEDEGDPRENLVKKLLLYKSFQEASIFLQSRPQKGSDFFQRKNFSLDELEDNTPQKQTVLSPVEPSELVRTFASILKNLKVEDSHNVHREKISIFARIHEVLEFCQNHHSSFFYELLKQFSVSEKSDVIVTFLAMLELTKLKIVAITEGEENFSFKIIEENYHLQKDYLEGLKESESFT